MRKSIFGLLLILSMVAMACGGGLEGEEVLMFGAPATDGPDGKAIQEVFDDFTEETGIIATYVGSENFESEVQVQLESGTAPDIIYWPQPGGVVDAAERGLLVPLEDLVYGLKDFRDIIIYQLLDQYFDLF